MLALDAAFQEAVDAFGEVVAVELDVKADDRAAEQAVENLLAPRADAEDFRVRPRNVPEGDDRRFRQLLPDHARQQREVIVLDQHDRPFVARFRDDDIGEFLVHRLVHFPVRGAEDGPREDDVAERP